MLFGQHSLTPEIGVHGMPMDNFSRSDSGGVNLSQLSVGLDLTEPANSNWSSTTSIRFKVCLIFLIIWVFCKKITLIKHQECTKRRSKLYMFQC